MDEQQVEKLEHVLRLFEQRTATFEAHTSEIIHAISDPVVRVICDVLNVDEDNISWEEVDVSSPLIAIRLKVYYEDENDIPEVLDLIAPVKEGDNNAVRTIVMAFPIIYAAASYEEFHEFLMHTVDKAIQKRKITTDDPVLTKDQQLQAYLHRPTRKVLH